MQDLQPSNVIKHTGYTCPSNDLHRAHADRTFSQAVSAMFGCTDSVITVWWVTEGTHTSILSAEDIEGEEHGIGEGGGLLLAGKVESIDLPGISPLVEGRGGLVVLETLHYGVVYNHL